MPEISSRVVAHVEALKAEIGWSWIEVQSRLGWSPMQVKNFRDQKRGLADDEYRFLQEVAEAVKGVRQPNVAEAVAEVPLPSENIGRAFTDDLNPGITQVRVMTMDDIARKLAEEYVSLAEEPEINGAELAAGRYAISRLAMRLGLVNEVKSNVKILNDGNAPALSARPQPFERPAPPPLSPRAQLPRPLPVADREEYHPPVSRNPDPISRVPFGEDGF